MLCKTRIIVAHCDNEKSVALSSTVSSWQMIVWGKNFPWDFWEIFFNPLVPSRIIVTGGHSWSRTYRKPFVKNCNLARSKKTVKEVNDYFICSIITTIFGSELIRANVCLHKSWQTTLHSQSQEFAKFKVYFLKVFINNHFIWTDIYRKLNK